MENEAKKQRMRGKLVGNSYKIDKTEYFALKIKKIKAFFIVRTNTHTFYILENGIQ